jgi:AbrB family looped-hinge helix DNA binding protein
LRLKVGKKGVIMLPKAVRDSASLKEGDTVIVELNDGINLRPERKVDLERLRSAFEEHDEMVKKLNTMEPELGGLSKLYLEEEFGECRHS